jgi:tRNA nucleotidyltransferase (CCA-adding enzyme)
MSIFNLKPSREIGLIKNALKEGILDGQIPNNREEAIKFAIEKGKELGLVVHQTI